MKLSMLFNKFCGLFRKKKYSTTSSRKEEDTMSSVTITTDDLLEKKDEVLGDIKDIVDDIDNDTESEEIAEYNEPTSEERYLSMTKELESLGVSNYKGCEYLLSFASMILKETIDVDTDCTYETLCACIDNDTNLVKRSLTFIRKKIDFSKSNIFYYLAEKEDLTNKDLLNAVINYMK